MTNPLQQLSPDDLRARTSMKWRTYPPDVLPVWVAEMDVPLAPPIAEALSETIERSDTGYAVPATYLDAAAGFAKARWDWGFEAERAALVPDVMLGIVELLDLLTDRGDAVVVNAPVYGPFYDFVRAAGRDIVEAPLDETGRIDLATLTQAFAQARSGRDRAAYLLCSPQNPTGAVHTRDELLGIASLAREHGVRVVADEIHAPVVHPGNEHIPFLSLPGTEDAMAVFSASKAWNLSGLKAAVAVAGPDAEDDLRQMPEVVGHGASHLGVIAHAAAFRDGTEWLERLLAGLDENRRLLADLLAEHLPEIDYSLPEGTYLAWLDCRGLGLGEDPAARFLERGRVALNSGPSFGAGGAGHARLNLATSPEVLTEAVRRMAAAV